MCTYCIDSFRRLRELDRGVTFGLAIPVPSQVHINYPPSHFENVLQLLPRNRVIQLHVYALCVCVCVLEGERRKNKRTNDLTLSITQNKTAMLYL